MSYSDFTRMKGYQDNNPSNGQSGLHAVLMKYIFTWACFLSLTWSKLRLCSANHRAGYFSNLACDWVSIVWAYSEQETENGPWYHFVLSHNWLLTATIEQRSLVLIKHAIINHTRPSSCDTSLYLANYDSFAGLLIFTTHILAFWLMSVLLMT